MWSVDRNLRLVISNRKFDETWGKMFRNDTFHEADNVVSRRLHFALLYERAFKGESFMETEYTEGPAEQWVDVWYHPVITANEITGVSCYGRDVTSHKHEIERFLLLESVVATCPDAILIAETGPHEKWPKIVYVNEALLRITGYSNEEIIGKNPNFLIGANSDRKQLNHLKECFECSKPCEIEIINYKKDGGEFWMNMAMAPVSDLMGGQPTHFIAIGRDVTERVRNIDAIKEQNIKLSEIARVQSHEVRGPLARIKGLINLLSTNTHSLDSKSATEIMQFLKISSNEMDAVISKIMIQTEGIMLSGKSLSIERVQDISRYREDRLP